MLFITEHTIKRNMYKNGDRHYGKAYVDRIWKTELTVNSFPAMAVFTMIKHKGHSTPVNISYLWQQYTLVTENPQ